MADKRKNKKSKEEIAREFDLPERKSKIATIMKQDGQAYCICRTSDCSRFMIGCDGCEEWYHGDCINITEKEAKHIRHYYCQRCKEEDPSLQTVFRVVPVEKTAAPIGAAGVNDTDKRKKLKDQVPPNIIGSAAVVGNKQMINHCGNCDGCRAPSCGICESCRVRGNGQKPRCEMHVCQAPPMQASQQQLVQPQIQQTNPPSTSAQTASRHKRKEKQPKERMRKRKRSLSPEVFMNPELEGIRQCYGPRCKHNARPQSKYCSHECGINLATNRIFQVLPQRVQEWNLSSCRAEEENKKQLDQIRSKQAVVRFALAELDKRHMELDMIVERAKHSTLDQNRSQDNNDIEDEQSMYCITCGHEIHSRTAIKHMEKCFNKYESQASFGSIFKTRIEGNSMFCDFYNPASKTYCKRLRVLCPEHCKDPKISDNDVCGCPLVANVFKPTGEFCRAPKKSCFKHYVWEKIRRAEIDLERVRQWLKMDELLEQERHIRHLMASRAGVLGLMLHSTYNHEVMEELCRQQYFSNAASTSGDMNRPAKGIQNIRRPV
ncbi:CXXC-type zinc finger protein 1-like isoform X1 [Rhagoletis pomonella]|uniref:CXXC-type zinc finger protein 1-like isoform X1 n=1 Tax=Rhagoletis pomonella TaxID=28610 RepID=UPI00177A9368|nr:CXXC-type zinc finger protein 1-like isoform X1 [Rhagoletis pomonella]